MATYRLSITLAGNASHGPEITGPNAQECDLAILQGVRDQRNLRRLPGETHQFEIFADRTTDELQPGQVIDRNRGTYLGDRRIPYRGMAQIAKIEHTGINETRIYWENGQPCGNQDYSVVTRTTDDNIHAVLLDD